MLAKLLGRQAMNTLVNFLDGRQENILNMAYLLTELVPSDLDEDKNSIAADVLWALQGFFFFSFISLDSLATRLNSDFFF